MEHRWINKIIVHHSLTKDSETVSWPAIRRYHEGVLGWRDIGYHAGIEIIKDKYEVLIGRPTHIQGAHTRGQNNNSLGFCFVGNYDKEEPTEHMLELAAERILVPWLLQFGLKPRDVHGHFEYSEKTCPGDFFRMERLVDCCSQIYHHHNR